MDVGSAGLKEQSFRKISYILFSTGCLLLVVAFVAGIADNPPGIISMLAGLFAVVLGIIFFFMKSEKRKPARQLLFWAPRALCIVYALFISMFALDVFDEGYGFWGTILALFMHLIPTYVIVILLAVSWYREWISGILFIGLGLFYIVLEWNKPFGTWSTFLIIAGPLIITGALFLVNWNYRSLLRSNQ